MANKGNKIYGRPNLFIELEFYILFLIGFKGQLGSNKKIMDLIDISKAYTRANRIGLVNRLIILAL